MRSSKFAAVTTVLISALLPVSTRAENIISFQSYNDALFGLLSPNTIGFLNFGTGFVAGSPPTSCPNLTNNANELDPNLTYEVDPFNAPSSPTPTGNGNLGPNLSRHCDALNNNSAFGSSLSSGFTSGIPTRTFLPFSGNKRRPSSTQTGDQSNQNVNTARRMRSHNNFVADDLFLVPLLTEPNLSLVVDFGNEEVEGTEFESGSSYREINIAAIAQYPVGDRTFYGFGANFGRKEGTVDAPQLAPLPTSGNILKPANQYLQIYQNACALVDDGEISETSFGAFAFGQRKLGEDSAINFDVGINYSRQEYRNDLCLFGFLDTFDPGPLFAGEISGRPKSVEILASISYQRQIELGKVLFFPSLGIRFSHKRISSYSETERTIPAIDDFLGNNSTCPNGACSANDEANLTGASLTYDAQEVTSIQSEIGGTLAIPVSGRRWNGNLFLDAYYFHEFNDDQREVVAQFAEDGRDNPTRFSFLVNPPSQNYFEVGLGLQAASSRDGSSALYLRASTILGDDTRDGYRLGGAWQFVF